MTKGVGMLLCQTEAAPRRAVAFPCTMFHTTVIPALSRNPVNGSADGFGRGSPPPRYSGEGRSPCALQYPRVAWKIRWVPDRVRDSDSESCHDIALATTVIPALSRDPVPPAPEVDAQPSAVIAAFALLIASSNISVVSRPVLVL